MTATSKSVHRMSMQRTLAPLADSQERLLGRAEVRELLRLSQSSLDRLVRKGALPPPRKIGGKAVWRASDINDYGARLFEGEVDR